MVALCFLVVVVLGSRIVDRDVETEVRHHCCKLSCLSREAGLAGRRSQGRREQREGSQIR